jgi:putative acetyltransferase
MVAVRPETHLDIPGIRRVNQLAFGSLAEVDLVDALRARQVHSLSLVASVDDEVVGHILCSPVTIHVEEQIHSAIGLGPMAILPDHQRRGIGDLRRAGHRVLVVLGHPDYYPRFGFTPATRYGIGCEFDVPDDVFMALELEPGALDECSGMVRYQPEFSAA